MFTTIYKTVRKGKKVWQHYQTKSHTDHHRFLRDDHAGATYAGGKVFTHFCEGLPLDKPFMSGGKRVSG